MTIIMFIYIGIAVVFGIGIYCMIDEIVSEKMAKNNGPQKNNKKFIIISWVIVGYIIVVTVAGFFIFTNLAEAAEERERQQEESVAASIAALSECERNGCQNEYEAYHNVLNGRWNLKNIYTDSYYEGQLGGSYSASGRGFLVWHTRESGTLNGSLTKQEVYKFFYETKDGGYKKDSVPTSSSTIYFLIEGENPYIETWTQYGEYKVCSVCGKSSYKWKVPFYKLYVPEGSIKEEINIE